MMRLRSVVIALSLLLSAAPTLLSQPVAPAPAQPVAPPTPCKGFQPVCSTEKVNGDCYVNIDRKYPITMPTFKLHRSNHITVCVFHPFPFETLTLDPGPASAYEGSDQAAALVTSLVTFGKGAIVGNTPLVALGPLQNDFSADIKTLNPQLKNLLSNSQVQLQQQPGQASELEQEIAAELQTQDAALTQATALIREYFNLTNAIYALIREIESAVPRPVADPQNTELLASGVPPDRANPWNDYSTWKSQILGRLTVQGKDTTALLDELPEACQPGSPPTGLWLAPRACGTASPGTIVPPRTALAIPPAYGSLQATIKDQFGKLSALMTNCIPDQQNPSTDCQQYLSTGAAIDALNQRHDWVSRALSDATVLLPGIITKATTDMQSVYEYIRLTPDASPEDPVLVGVIPGPNSGPAPTDAEKNLFLYKSLAPTITYTLNEQNEIANSLLGLPAATQKQSVETITALYAAPRFEGSTGAFFSWLPNRTYSNLTNVSVGSCVPSPTLRARGHEHTN